MSRYHYDDQVKRVQFRLCWDVCGVWLLIVVVDQGRVEVEDGSCERSCALFIQRTASVDKNQSRYVKMVLHVYDTLVFRCCVCHLLLMIVMIIV